MCCTIDQHTRSLAPEGGGSPESLPLYIVPSEIRGKFPENPGTEAQGKLKYFANSLTKSNEIYIYLRYIFTTQILVNRQIAGYFIKLWQRKKPPLPPLELSILNYWQL